MDSLDRLLKLYQTNRVQIEKRLRDFKRVGKQGDEEIFAELCFCLLTPQSRAEACDDIIQTLKKKKLLLKGDAEAFQPFLKKTRFYKTKSNYLVEAKRLFQENGTVAVKKRLHPGDVHATREWLVENVKGIGYKEASHFLRNIGLGESIAILDRHVLRALGKLGILRRLPKSLTKKRYLKIEEKMRQFADQLHIPVSHLDLLFWSSEANRIFK